VPLSVTAGRQTHDKAPSQLQQHLALLKETGMKKEAGKFVNTVWATDWQKLGPNREKPWGCLLERGW